MARGFLHYEDHPVSVSQAALSTSIGRELISFSLNEDFAFRFRQAIGYADIPGRKSAAEINQGFLSWLSRQRDDRPFFAFLNYLDAHQPFLPPAPFDGKFRGDAPRGDPRHWWSRTWSPGQIQTEIDAYDESIAYIDDQIGALFDELKRRGELDHTVVVVTSDHGEHMGEHGFMRHGNTLYPEVLRVPLMILFPDRIKATVTVGEPVTLRDLPATVLALAGQDCDGCFPGHSLTRHWESQDGTTVAPSTSPAFAEVSRGIRLPDRYPNAKGDLKSLIADGMHYIVNSNGREELYDLVADPGEARNLAGSNEMAEIRDRFRLRLKSIARN
jgi:arylsulfatase A-like enzyme